MEGLWDKYNRIKEVFYRDLDGLLRSSEASVVHSGIAYGISHLYS